MGALAVMLGSVLGLGSTNAFATWTAPTTGVWAFALACTLPAVALPTATNTAYGAAVTVTWPAASYAGGDPVGSYVVRAYDVTTGAARAVGAGCAWVVHSLTCTETATPEGRWRYTVAAAEGTSWVGPESAPSLAVAVDTTPPQVSLVALPARVRADQVLAASVTDAVSGVASVTYQWCAGLACIPSTPIGTSTTGPDFAVTWTDEPTDGSYRIAARAVDAAGHWADGAAVPVTIDNTAPVVALTTPVDGFATNATTVSFAGVAGTDTGDSPTVAVLVHAGIGAAGTARPDAGRDEHRRGVVGHERTARGRHVYGRGGPGGRCGQPRSRRARGPSEST